MNMTTPKLYGFGGDLSFSDDITLTMPLAGTQAFGVDSNRLFLWKPGTLYVYDLNTQALLQSIGIAGGNDKNAQIVFTGTSIWLKAGNYIGRVAYSPVCFLSIPAGWYALPDSPGYVTDGVSVVALCSTLKNEVAATAVVLSDIVTALCSRVGITASQLDVSQLTDSVRGFVVGQPMSAADAVRSLQQGYFFDFPEWGDYTDATTKLRGIKRGGASVFTITDDDLLESDDDEDARPQAVEFPRKLNLITSDVDADYNPTKQTAERRTENVKAVGEANVQLPLSLTRAEAAPKADIMLKVAWMEAEGRTQFMLPEEFSAMVPSDPFMKDGKRWRAEQIEYGDGTVSVKAVRDRVSAYSSDATSGGAIAPTAPTSGIRGPTLMIAVNLPPWRSSDATPGMYIAAQGLLPGWPGCYVLMSVDGGVSFDPVLDITIPATIGELADPVTAGSTAITVKTHGAVLSSVTAAQVAAGANLFALVSGGVGEAGQYQTATDNGSNHYTLTDLTRPALGTSATNHSIGDGFVKLDSAVRFLAIDPKYAGQNIIFKAVTKGTIEANAPSYSVVYDPATFFIDGGEVTP